MVNNASIAGTTGIGGLTAYVAAKHGVVGLTRAAALAHAADGIRINALVTGNVDTPLYRERSASARRRPCRPRRAQPHRAVAVAPKRSLRSWPSTQRRGALRDRRDASSRRRGDRRPSLRHTRRQAGLALLVACPAGSVISARAGSRASSGRFAIAAQPARTPSMTVHEPAKRPPRGGSPAGSIHRPRPTAASTAATTPRRARVQRCVLTWPQRLRPRRAGDSGRTARGRPALAAAGADAQPRAEAGGITWKPGNAPPQRRRSTRCWARSAQSPATRSASGATTTSSASRPDA